MDHIYRTLIRLNNIYVCTTAVKRNSMPANCKSTLGWDPHAQSIYIPKALSACTGSAFVPLWRMMTSRPCGIPTARTHQTCNIETSIVQLLKRKKRNAVQEYTDQSTVHVKGKVIICFPLVFKFHQLMLHLHMQLPHFKKNWWESMK